MPQSNFFPLSCLHDMGDLVKVVVTGAAGFIGSHLSQELLEKGYYVIAIDSMNPYYDIRLKQTHLKQIQQLPEAAERFHYHQFDINEPNRCAELFDREKPRVIVHLAAQAGVRYCQANPEEAESNNIKTTRLLLDLAHRPGSSVKQFLFASSSSIYGTHPRPWNETYEPKPEGIYGESKAKGEEMCAAIFHKDQVSIAAMRFFTVYGPFGRPDMAPAKFMDIIHRGKIVPVYGDGSAIRDFTFVEDIIQGIRLIIEHPSYDKFEIYNLGKGTDTPHSVLDLIRSIEVNLNKKANINFTDPQAGDVPATQADITKAQTAFGYNPLYTLEDGIKKTVPIYFRNLDKYVTVLLQTKDNSELLSQQLETFNEQSEKPKRVIVLDESTEDNYTKNQVILKEYNDQFSLEHIQVTNPSDANQLWQSGYSRLESHLKERINESFEEPSNIFVCFVHSPIEWSTNTIESIVEEISSSGYEYVGTPSCSLLRLDVLLKHNQLPSSKSHEQYVSSLSSKIQFAENIRTNIH